MNRRQFLRTLSLGAAALALPGCATAHRRTPSRRRPNILLIVSDDQGYNDLGCYGGTEIKTPNLDRLAADGVRLRSFYVTWPACTPSRGSLLTGRYPQRNGTYDMFRNDKVDYDYKYGPDEYAVSWEQVGGMDTREVLIPRVLKKAGYASGIFGKWDLGQLHRFLPLQRGFDEFYGYTNTGIDYFTHERYGVPSMRRGNQGQGDLRHRPLRTRGPAIHRKAQGPPFSVLRPIQRPPRSIQPRPPPAGRPGPP